MQDKDVTRRGKFLMSQPKHSISWNALQGSCTRLASDIASNVTHIVGVSRGGLIPATILAHQLNIPRVYTVGMSSYGNETSSSKKKSPIIYQNCFEQNASDITPDDRILLVDDICDTGDSFNVILDFASNRNIRNIITASLYVRSTSNYIPIYYSSMIDDDRWIVFPYEQSTT